MGSRDTAESAFLQRRAHIGSWSVTALLNNCWRATSPADSKKPRTNAY